MKILRTVLAVAALAAPTFAFGSTWEIDPSHSSATFAVRHLMVNSVRGELGKVTGMVELDDKDVSKSSIQASVEMGGINTREPKRDEHLKSPDFFDVAKYPTMTFKSKRIEKGADANHFKAVGDLTIKNVTKEVTLDVEASSEVKDPYGQTKRGATATTKINRTDFGLKWNKALEGGGLLVGEDVNVTLDIEVAKKAAGKKS